MPASRLLACSALALCLGAPAQTIKLTAHAQTLDVTVDNRPFTTYHFADNYFYEPVRPFLYPVLAADGTNLTTDQQQTDPKHGYQRSIWVGHGDVNGTDHWKFKTPLAKQKHLSFDWIHSDGFQEELLWTDKDGKPQLTETRTMRFHAYADGTRAIDITLAFHATSGDVTFGTHGDRGLLSVRLQQSLYHAPTFLSAEGTAVCETPKEKAAPDTTHVPAIHTAWCDESGLINGKLYGAAIFDAPANPRHAPAWHARPDARLATDIFQHPLTIPSGTTATFRYSVLLHVGTGAAADLPSKYAGFAETQAAQ